MSIYYTVKEHLSINNTTDLSDLISLAAEHITLIRERLRSENSNIFEFKLTADGKQFSFSNNSDLLDALKNAKSIDYTMYYGYYNDFCDNVGPFELCNRIEEKLKNNEALADNIFFSMYNSADCEPGAGILCAYGKKNGVFYNGALKPVSSKLPKEGLWINADTCVVFDDELTDSMNLAQIRECAEAYSAMGNDADIDFYDGPKGIGLFVNHIELKSKKDFEKFIETCKKLLAATDRTAGITGKFIDLDSEDARILVIDFEDDGTYTVKTTVI